MTELHTQFLKLRRELQMLKSKDNPSGYALWATTDFEALANYIDQHTKSEVNKVLDRLSAAEAKGLPLYAQFTAERKLYE